ncbi:MAG: hypothetical protein MI784_17050 [Cytophagales bacterium]|nr:hypothetical protein [Cytophagales bacterium]
MKFLSKLLKAFKPKYSVEFRIYQVVPGRPVTISKRVELFGRGENDKALDYYRKAVAATKENKVAPVEIVIKKGKKPFKGYKYGPVDEIKSMKLAA